MSIEGRPSPIHPHAERGPEAPRRSTQAPSAQPQPSGAPLRRARGRLFDAAASRPAQDEEGGDGHGCVPPAFPAPLLDVRGVAKSFRMHLRGGVELPVVRDVSFAVAPGECVVLGGPSGVGKSSILRMVYGNYGVDRGSVLVRDARTGRMEDLASGGPRLVLALRARSLAYVSQFLRAVPRVSALDVVAEPLVARGTAREDARERAAAMLRRLNLPAALHGLPPATFSGGEKQRVNIARGFLTDHPVLLLDEPTASLDAANRDVVVAMIREKLSEGCALLGIFHDDLVRERVATRTVDVSRFSVRKAA